MNFTTKILLRRFEQAVRQLAMDECESPRVADNIASSTDKLKASRRDLEAELERLEQLETNPHGPPPPPDNKRL